MIAIDTKEKLDWLLNALENNELQVISRKLTKEDDEEMCRAIAEYRAAHPKTTARDMVLAD